MLKRRIFAWIAIGLFTCTPLVRSQEPIPAPQLTEAGPLAGFLTEGGERTSRQIWVRGDYLFGFMTGDNFFPLATTSPVGTPKSFAGIVGVPTTQVLFGGWQNDDLRAGFRIQGGMWFGGERNLGMEAGFMFMGGQTSSFFADFDAFPILARPFIDARTGNSQAVLVAFPGSSTGSIDIQAESGSFWSANLNLTENAFDYEGFRLTALVGYRFYKYNESLRIRQTLITANPALVPGTTAVTNDSFTTDNEFHGFDMGFRTEHTWGNFSLELLAKLAVGDVTRRVEIIGDQTVVVPGAGSVTESAGVLALATNSGSFVAHDWKVIPEVGGTLGWQVRPNLSLRVGYSLLVLNGIARAADQVDVRVNPNFFPPPNGKGGPNLPAFNNVRADMWIQSLNLGVLWTF